MGRLVSRTALVAALAAAMTGLFPVAAAAQQVDLDTILRRAGEHCRQGNLEQARALYEEAFSRGPTSRVLAEQAYCEQHENHWVEAEGHLNDALAAEDSWVRRRRGALQDLLTEIRRHLGRLAIAGIPDGAELRIGGRRVATFPMREPLRVNAGIIEAEIRAEGFRPWRHMMEIPAGGTTSETVTLQREREAEASPVVTGPTTCSDGLVLRNGLCYDPRGDGDTPTAPRVWRVVGIAGAAVAVVAASVAIGVGVSANGDEADYLARCGGAAVPMACVGDRANVQTSLDGQAAMANVFWVVAGVGAVGAAVGFGLDAQRPRRSALRAGWSLSPSGVRLIW